ncbi:MAG: hypothetical protein AABO41_19755 [Acidobacteriota bacterium]
MKTKRAVMMGVLVLAVAALVVPLIGARAASTVTGAKGVAAPKASTAVAKAPMTAQQQVAVEESVGQSQGADGKISPETLKALGISRLPKGVSAMEVSQKLADRKILGKTTSGTVTADAEVGPPLVGLTNVLNSRSALSAAILTTVGGRDNQFSEVGLIADWDGREDCNADHSQKVDDFSFVEADIDASLTRTAISEHTVANGFNENVYYYGDSLGNLWVGTDSNPGSNAGSPNGSVDSLRQINIPALVNSPLGSGGFSQITGIGCVDDQVTVTGIAVQPVADLADFGLALCGTIGEVVYVSIFDSEGCASNAAGQPIRTRIFAFAFVDGVGAGAMTPASATARLQIFSAQVGNVAGVAVDDDGSLYFHLVDLIQFTGGAIFKAAPIPHVPVTGCSLRSTRVVPSVPTVGLTSVTPLSSASVRLTNYSSGSPGAAGTITPLFGDIVSIATGPCNVVYAAVSRSFRSADDGFTQLTEGRFAAPAAFPAGTPSMIISFADCSGAFDVCSGEATGSIDRNLGGILPVADGFSDGPTVSAARTVGVNNFRIFAEGDGPDLAPPPAGTAIVPGTPSTLLRLAFQIDYTMHSGLAVSQEGTVFVISGGTPAGIGTNPSALLGEVLCFEDMCPMDRRADFVDLRGDALPNPPASGGNVGDGDSDRFDHIFYQSPLDQVTLTPGGLAGLAIGHLRYAWRLAPNAMGPGVLLGVTKTMQGDDDTDGPIIFENLDPGHQVAGGDDQQTPFRGDDNDGAGTPPLAGALSGGFEFVFGGPVGTAGCTWNAFFLNSNGNITFGVGDISGGVGTDPPNVPNFREGPPKIAPAWADLNPSARLVDLRDFPVQALGFANINAFKVRWINVPEFGNEVCTGDGGGFSNTFAVTLYDDGTGTVTASPTSSDENNSQLLNPANPIGNNSVPFDWAEGPTDLRFTRELNTGVIVGCSPRPSGSGIFLFEYCRMDLIGTEDSPVIVGYSIGGLDGLNPPGLCETNLSIAALNAETTFGLLIGNQTAAIGCNCLIGEGTEPTIFELFNEGLLARTGAGGEQVFATADFDLRFEGNDPALCTSSRQHDFNRGKVGFRGIGCAPPANPICQTVVAGPFVTTPGSGTDLVDTLCAVPLQLVGCGFFPNEVTIICQGFEAETGVPLQRPGKTVTTAATLSCDTNGDGIAETTVVLATTGLGPTGLPNGPINCNLIRATIPVSASFGPTPTSPPNPGSTSGFPAACCGGAGTVLVTTTFSSGDNNAFGPFTRTFTCSLALGTRAPVVLSVTPSSGSCSVLQDLLISGACFIINGVPSVTSVFAIDRADPARRIDAAPFTVLSPFLIDAFFNFTSANAGRTFLIFVQGPGGISRNLLALPAGSPTPCTTGNEQGIQVTFTCSTSTTPGPTPGSDIAVLTRCALSRDDVSGGFRLDVFGSNIKLNAGVTINGQVPKKIQFKDLETGSTDRFTRVRLKKQICSKLNGAASIVITNPGGQPSATLLCTATCPTN